MQTLNNIWSWLTENLVWLLWLILLFLTLVVGKTQLATMDGCTYTNYCDKNRIILLEFAHTPEEASRLALMDAPAVCQDDCRHERMVSKVQHNTLYDLLFILCYTSLSIVSFNILWSNISFKRLPAFWWVLLFLPGICDLIENNFIFQFTSGMPLPNAAACDAGFFDAHFFLLYYLVVRIKWALAVWFALVFLAVLLYLLLIIFDTLFAWLDALRMFLFKPKTECGELKVK